jgi:hypothetical protein
MLLVTAVGKQATKLDIPRSIRCAGGSQDWCDSKLNKGFNIRACDSLGGMGWGELRKG